MPTWRMGSISEFRNVNEVTSELEGAWDGQERPRDHVIELEGYRTDVPRRLEDSFFPLEGT